MSMKYGETEEMEEGGGKGHFDWTAGDGGVEGMVTDHFTGSSVGTRSSITTGSSVGSMSDDDEEELANFLLDGDLLLM
jgi:hypothetical protein